VLPVLFRRRLRLIIIVDGITDIVTEGITTDITTTGTTIDTGPGLSASMGVQDIIGIGKRIIAHRASPFFESTGTNSCY
jgi:hypothetical protein